MLFTLKRPKSERFFQLRFNGFRPYGRSKIEKFVNVAKEFGKAFVKYIRRKIRRLITFISHFAIFLRNTVISIKSYIIRKLIWSRGRLGRPLATFAVMGVAFVVFLLGEVFNSSKFVNSQEISSDYLSNVSDIIPPKNIALTSVPESRRTEPILYAVEGGDTLYGIGEKFKVSVDALKYVNNLTDYSVLKPGQQMTIPPVSGLVHKVKDGDTIQSIAKKYDVPAQAIADFNYILDTSKLALDTELIVPGAKVPQPVYVPPAIPSVIVSLPSGNAEDGWCMWPTTTHIVTQYYSWYHNGIDIATTWGSSPPIFACGGGTVTRSGWDPWGLGLHVRISHPGGFETVYGHMSKLYVSYGDDVSQGETIGLMGSTGNSTGPHVHFIIHYGGVAQNPMNYVQ